MKFIRTFKIEPHTPEDYATIQNYYSQLVVLFHSEEAICEFSLDEKKSKKQNRFAVLELLLNEVKTVEAWLWKHKNLASKDNLEAGNIEKV